MSLTIHGLPSRFAHLFGGFLGNFNSRFTGLHGCLAGFGGRFTCGFDRFIRRLLRFRRSVFAAEGKQRKPNAKTSFFMTISF